MRCALAGLFLGIALSPLASASTQDPARFVATATAQRLGGRAGIAWDKLLPAHQRLITRAHFIRCERTVHGTDWHLRHVEYVRSRKMRIHYRGVAQTTATRVWLRVKFSNGPGTRFVAVWPVDAVVVGGRLRWLLDESTADQIRQNPQACWE
jgi:hypothetical protein